MLIHGGFHFDFTMNDVLCHGLSQHLLRLIDLFAEYPCNAIYTIDRSICNLHEKYK